MRVNLLSNDEGAAIIDGLQKIRIEWEEGHFVLCSTDEDIHTAIERRLTEIIGIAIAGKLHTGRSRNDQTITDTKLWIRKAMDEVAKVLISFIKFFVARADEEKMIIMPGYTHLQRAQPIRWSHWLLSHAWNMKNDYTRLVQIRERVNVMPLGSGALAGNPFGIDRFELAKELGFSEITNNSVQAVGDRDFVVEYLFWLSLTSIHLSRLAEDLVIYSSQEFNFVKFSDGFSTGSSLMPQKRNPDCVELIRGKTGTLMGKFVGFMATLKGLSSSYNKDLQEDKEVLFTSHDTLFAMLKVLKGAMQSLSIDKAKCQAALENYMLATDIAYYLVRKGISFREAHHVAGKVVAHAESKKLQLQEITLSELISISQMFCEDVTEIWDFEKSVEQYSVIGGTSLSSIENQIHQLRQWSRQL
ncbi:argininosuccinate lyase isoform X2 [Venturia canescens]|nr:argininosuccinate lyase isoform X2 [Venturia canescens]